MTDIISELRARLSYWERELAESRQHLGDLEKRVAELDHLVGLYDEALEKELALAAGKKPDDRPKVTLPEFIESLIRDTPLSKDQIRDAAEQARYGKNGGLGRSIHSSLINLMRGERVLLTPDGRYIAIGQRTLRDVLQSDGLRATEPSDESYGAGES